MAVMRADNPLPSPLPDGGGAEALPRIERIDTYKAYQEREGIPILNGFGVEDIKAVELGQWARRGGRGTFVDLDGNGGINDAYIGEIPAGGALAPQRQLYEEMVYVVSGNGSTSVWNDPARKISFETSEGTWMSVDVSPDGQTLLFTRGTLTRDAFLLTNFR